MITTFATGEGEEPSQNIMYPKQNNDVQHLVSNDRRCHLSGKEKKRQPREDVRHSTKNNLSSSINRVIRAK